MPTDDERREVAWRLRESAEGKFDFCAHNIALEIGMDDPSDFDECFDGEHLEAWGRLADLIEPPARCPHYMYPCCRTDAGGDYIDRDALLALAEDVDGAADDSGGFEPLAGMLRDISRRIREACGEVAS